MTRHRDECEAGTNCRQLSLGQYLLFCSRDKVVEQPEALDAACLCNTRYLWFNVSTTDSLCLAWGRGWHYLHVCGCSHCVPRAVLFQKAPLWPHSIPSKHRVEKATVRIVDWRLPFLTLSGSRGKILTAPAVVSSIFTLYRNVHACSRFRYTYRTTR